MSKFDASVPGAGLSTFMASAADGSTPLQEDKQQVSAGPCRLYGYWLSNLDATATNYVSFYNFPSASVTVGTTPPLMQLSPGAGVSANLSLEHGIEFSRGLTVAATTTAGGNTAPASDLAIVIWYAPINLLS